MKGFFVNFLMLIIYLVLSSIFDKIMCGDMFILISIIVV
jgi:hypothetical protein